MDILLPIIAITILFILWSANCRLRRRLRRSRDQFDGMNQLHKDTLDGWSESIDERNRTNRLLEEMNHKYERRGEIINKLDRANRALEADLAALRAQGKAIRPEGYDTPEDYRGESVYGEAGGINPADG